MNSYMKVSTYCPLVSVNSKDELKVNSLLREYSELKQEVRTFEVLAIVCISISILLFIAMFIAAVLSNQYILLFISPGLSIFFAILAMAMLAYNTNLGLRASQIEEHLKEILGEPTIQWESTIGVFGGLTGDILNKQVGSYWFKFSMLALVTGIVSIVFSLLYGFEGLYIKIGNVIWFILGFYIAITIATTYVGYRFYTRGWEKLKLSLS
jgi:hypothetical protein